MLLGHGRMQFTPPDPAERTQVKIFGGAETLAVNIDTAFLRLNPGDFASRVDAGALRPSAVNPADLRAASAIFNAHIGESLQVDLSDLSRDRWSLLPSSGDVIGELHSKKFGTLTYTRSGSDAEDITLFDRKQHHNISVYASPEKLAERGRSYSEDSSQDYDVLTYDIEAEFTPERGTVEGNARITLRMLAENASLSFHLADTLDLRGVYSPAYRPAAPPARGWTEHRDREPAGGAETRNAALADGSLRWTDRAAGLRSRGHPGRRCRRRSRSTYRSSSAGFTAIGATGIPSRR